MNLFSLFVPGNSWLHRLGVAWKYLILVAVTFPALIVGNAVISLGALAITAMLLLSCRARVRLSLRLPAMFWLLVVILAGYQIAVGQYEMAVVVPTNLITAVYASRILTLTTPGPVLIDAGVQALAPLRWVGLDPERVGLAIAIMVRSVPVLLDAFGEVRQAARARGRERNLFALIAPVVVRAVAYAQATGAAIAARGIGDP